MCKTGGIHRGKQMNKKVKSNEELVLEYQNSTDEKERKRIADLLYRKIYRLVVKNAGTMSNICYGTQEDLIQQASLVFMKCLNKFDCTKGYKFSTYFGDSCKYELRRYKDKLMRHIDNSYYLEIDEILQAKPDNVEDWIDDVEAVKRIQLALLKLKEENKITIKQFNAIIEEHGFFGQDKKTRKEMAQERNCSLQNVGFLYRKAINKIKDELNTGINTKE